MPELRLLTLRREHVYRRHSLKNLCARCFEHFDKPEALKAHQRAKVPCELKQQSPDTITDEQEKQLRARAKPNWSEETKWQEMYRIIFPGEDVPSPCTSLLSTLSTAHCPERKH